MKKYEITFEREKETDDSVRTGKAPVVATSKAHAAEKFLEQVGSEIGDIDTEEGFSPFNGFFETDKGKFKVTSSAAKF